MCPAHCRHDAPQEHRRNAQGAIDRFGVVDDENAAPEEVENLFFLIRAKILALESRAEQIAS